MKFWVQISSLGYQGLEQLQCSGTEQWRLIYVEKFNNNSFLIHLLNRKINPSRALETSLTNTCMKNRSSDSAFSLDVFVGSSHVLRVSSAR